jgi:WD40 repeat protein
MAEEGDNTGGLDEKGEVKAKADSQDLIRYPVASLHNTPVRCVALHPKQPLLAIGFDTGVIHVWNVVTHQMMVSLRSPGSIASPVSGLCFSPDGMVSSLCCGARASASYECESVC